MGYLSWLCMAKNCAINHREKKHDDPPAAKSWSDLPDDIISLIMENLCYSDQIRCRAVCKSWQSNIKGVKYADKLPWIFSYSRYKVKGKSRKRSRLCYLFDPSHKQSYTIKLKKANLVCAKALASNNGWILFSKGSDFTWPYSSAFFYNPFTDEIIMLRIVIDEFSVSGILFSETPTSPECMIFTVGFWGPQRCFAIQTFCLGDTKWTTHSCDSYNYGDILGVAYLKGVLYFASQAALGTFNASTRELKIYRQNLWLPPSNIFTDHCLIEFEGNLIMLHRHWFLNWRVFLFDWDQKKWLEVENYLADKMLLIDYMQGNLLSVGSEEKQRELANILHHIDRCHSCYIPKSPARAISPPNNFGHKQSQDLTDIWVHPPRIR